MGHAGGLDPAERGALKTAVDGGFGRRRRGRKAGREHSSQPVVVGQGRDSGGFAEKKFGRAQERDRWEATRAGGERRGWMSLKQVNPLRDLWEGASLGGRELPWTRKERARGREGRKEGKRRCCFVNGKVPPPGLCDVLDKMIRAKRRRNLQVKGYTGKEISSDRARCVWVGGRDERERLGECGEKRESKQGGRAPGQAELVLVHSGRRRRTRTRVASLLCRATATVGQSRTGQDKQTQL
jgi:hypothetical protein